MLPGNLDLETNLDFNPNSAGSHDRYLTTTYAYKGTARTADHAARGQEAGSEAEQLEQAPHRGLPANRGFIR